MSKDIDSIFQFDITSEQSLINSINLNDNNEFISPIENLTYCPSPSLSTNCTDLPKRKKFPNYPIKNIFLPELFLEQEYLEQFKCGICENICDEPVIPCCGCDKLFCRKCLLFYYENNHNECPECKKVTRDFSKVSAVDTIIKLKKMKCINYTENCTWQGKCLEYRDHITKQCPKEIINCPYKGCIIKLKREEMENHMKNCELIEIICDKCKLKIPKSEKDEHKSICLKELILCPQGCKNIIERGDFNLHKQNCSCSTISCPFSLFGCEDQFQKKEKELRLKQDMEKHLNLTMDKILTLVDDIKQLNQKVQNMENEIVELKNKDTNDNNKTNDKNKTNEKKITENVLNKSFIELNDSPIKENSMCLLKYENGVKNNQEINKDKEIKMDKLSIKEHTKSYLSNKRKSSHNMSQNNNNDSFNENSKCDENDEELNSDNLIIQQQNDMYDLSHLEKDIINLFMINYNKIESNHLRGKKQYYIFFNKRYDIPKTSSKKYKIKYKLLKDTQWLGIGICDRKVVANNNYEFTPAKRINGKSPNIGTYVISTSKMAWNCNNVSQCRKFSCSIKQDTIFELLFSPSDCELEFKCENKVIVKFNDVRCFKSEFFSPCLIFLHNSVVESNFYYS